MDFIQSLLTLNTLAYALIGIPALLGFVVMVRLSRQGRSSFTQRHKAMEERIQQTTSEMDELNKTMHESEQLHIIATALQDAVRLHSQIDSIFIEEQEHFVRVVLGKYVFFVLYKEKKHTMRSTGKTVYGQGYFEVLGPMALSELHPPLDSNNAKNQGKIFYSLLELELYLTQKMQRPQNRSLPPALRKKN